MCLGGSGGVEETAEQGERDQINQQMWGYYQKDFAPLRDKYIASVEDPKTTAAEKNKVAGEVNADVMKNVKPASPGNAVANAKNLMSNVDVEAAGKTTGKLSVEANQIGQEKNIIAMGKGQQTKAMAGMDELANMSVQNAIANKEREEQVAGSQENAMGSLIGTEAAIGMYGAKKKPKTLDDHDDVDYSDLGAG